VACHQFNFLEKFEMLKYAKPGGVFLLNSLYGRIRSGMNFRVEVQEQIVKKKLKFYVINGYEVAEKTGMGAAMNTIMQTASSPSAAPAREQAIAEIKHAIEKTYGNGARRVKQNFAAVTEPIETSLN